MGRRSEHSREELTDLIVAAALELVQQNGPTGVTARQIAKSIGYTPGSLYSIFENLQAIYLHVNVVSLNQLYEQCIKAKKKARGPEKSINAMGQAYLNFAANQANQFQLMFQPISEPDVLKPAELDKSIRVLFELIEQELKKLNPAAVESDVKLGARTLWSGVHGAAALSLTNQLYSDRKNSDRLIVEMLVNRFVDSWKR